MPRLQFKHVRHPIETAKLSKRYFLTKPHRVEAYARVVRELTKCAEPEKWVFVVGCYNSGTTLLSQLLATHSAISRLDEGVFKTSQLSTPEELGYPRLWCQVVDQVRLKAGDRSVNAEKLKKDWMLFFDRKKTVFLEKSIVNSARMTWLQENFANSYFLFIVRDGYAVSEGIRRQTSKAFRGQTSKGLWYEHIRSRFHHSYPIELCAEQWVTNNAIIESDAKGIRYFKRIFYEDFCEHPKETVADIYAFLGLDDKSSVLLEGQRWKIHEYDSEIKNMNDRSFENLSGEDIRKIETVAGEMLTYYGYQRPSGSQSKWATICSETVGGRIKQWP
jgi:Sulfotransferase family